MSDRTRRLVAAALGLACLGPAAFLVTLSIAGPWRFPHVLPESWEAGRWVYLWAQEAGLSRSLGISLFISTAVAALSTALGFLAGKYVAYHPRRRILMMLAYLPFVISPVIAGVCLLYVYLRLGLAGGIGGVIVAQLVFTVGFAIIFFSGFWNEEKRALADLTRTLGGSGVQVYLHALLPVSRSALTLCFFQTFLISWFQYGLTLLIGSGRVRTLPLKVYDYIGEANVAFAALGSCLLVLPPVILLWTGRRLLGERGRHVP